METTEFVTDRQWDGQARRIERQGFRERGSSLTVASIQRRAQGYVVEMRDGGRIARKGWREAMKQEPQLCQCRFCGETALTGSDAILKPRPGECSDS